MPSLPQVWLNFVAECTRIVWWLGRICCYYLVHALDILSIKTVLRPLCEVHRQIAYYDSRKWVNLKPNFPIIDKYLQNQNPNLGHGKKEELCYDCLEKQWVPIMCSQFHLRWSGKSYPIHSGDGIAFPMRKDWWPPWMPTDLLFLVTLFPPSIHQTVKNVHPSLSLNVFHRTLSSPRSQGPFGGQWLEPTAKKSPKHVSNLHCCISKCTLHPWIEFTFNLGILEARPVVSNLTTRKWRRYRRKSMPLQLAALRWTMSSLWWELENANIRA